MKKYNLYFNDPINLENIYIHLKMEVSFLGKKLKLDNEKDGKLVFLQVMLSYVSLS